MKATALLSLVVLSAVVLGGCSGGDSSNAPTKDQEQELRHPSHVPPAGYRPPTTTAPPPPAARPNGG